MFQFTFPPVTHSDWIIVLLLGLIISSALIYVALSDDAQTHIAAKIPTPKWLWLIIGTLGFTFLALATISGLSMLLSLASGKATPSYGTGALIAAILGAPFIIWRTLVAAKQTATAAESLLNEKFNSAAKNLAARREITRTVNAGTENETVLREWQDDLVTRISAIDRLEGLANETPELTARVARLFSNYIREMTEEHPPEVPPKDASPEKRAHWAENLRVKRRDMEKATQSLIRLQTIEGHNLEPGAVKLSECNLQGFDFSYLKFAHADFRDAQMQGATLSFTEMTEVNFFRADLCGARLFATQFLACGLETTNLAGARLLGARVENCRMNNLTMDVLTSLLGLRFLGSSMRNADVVTAQKMLPFKDEIFADGSVELDPAQFPDHWSKDKLGYSAFNEKWRAWQATLDPKDR